jgi:hypothetical protein
MINLPSDGRHLVYFIYLYISRGLEINSQCRRRGRGTENSKAIPLFILFLLVRTIERLRPVGMKNEELLIQNDIKKMFQT